jgi:hypothetical protein
MSHLSVEVPSYIVSHQARTTIHTCLKKGKCVFAKRIKGRPAQKLPRRWRVIIVVSPPLRHLRRRDVVTILDIVGVEHARHGEYR